ncbi:SGNH/GDSL hydrolase family protein [bacterium]|nr:SGNH/GDSL hydrolase family protein [candidate division CSSED10-310 bacterium]
MTNRSHPLPICKRLVFALIVCTLFFGSMEGVLRLIGFEWVPGTYESIEGDVIEYHWSTRGLVRDPVLPWSWIPKPGAVATQPARNDFVYNRDGFRGPVIALETAKRTIRVICMGDSCTLGWDSPDNQTYPDYLRLLLDRPDPGTYQVINAGVSGFSSFQGLHDFRHRIRQWHPDILIISYNWNDHGDAPDRIAGPAVYTPTERRQFMDKDMPTSYLLYNFRNRISRARVFQAMQWAGHRFGRGRSSDTASATGTAAEPPAGEPVVEAAGRGQPSAFPPGTGLRRVEPEDYRLNLWEFRRLAKQEGIRLIFLTQPANPVQHRDIEPWKTYYMYQDQYNSIMCGVGRESGTPVVDAAGWNDWREEHFYDHVHMRPSANEQIATWVSREVILAAGKD